MRKLQTLCLTLALAPSSLLAQYVYHYTDSLTSIGSSWTQNGSASGTSAGLTATSSGGGSLIYNSTMPGPTGEYEVATTLTLATSGGTYVSYLNASSTAISGSSPAGTFYDVELQSPTCSGGTCSATLAINKKGSGGFSTLASTSVSCSTGVVIRAVHIAGSEIIVYLNNVLTLSAVDSELTSGEPGVGAFSTPTGNSVALVQLGQLDTTSPNAFNSSLIGTSSFANRVDIQSPGVSDNTGGTGVAFYAILRATGGGSFVYMATLPSPEWSDTTVSAGTTYHYEIAAYDYHFNGVLSSTFSITPTSGAVDPRRVGVRPTGAYWGANPEQLDLLSGNLSYSLPLLKAQGRNGWGVGFSLSYNSENWRQDSGGTWDLGRDVGFGYGWKLLAGSLTPYWSGYYTLDHWTFTDSTGAEYRLTTNTSGVWTSAESVYLSYNSNTSTLYFPDGSFWTMGATSAGSEQDAGTLYPTVMEDTNGNQVLLTYADGVGVSWGNSSARITQIADVRAVNAGSGDYYTYAFTYNSDSIPHLTGISNTIGTGESYSFDYYTSTTTLKDPFSGASYGTVGFLKDADLLANSTSYGFQYDTSSSTPTAGSLTQVTLPYKGYLGWVYSSIIYSGPRTQQEVSSRSLYKGGATSTSPPNPPTSTNPAVYPIYHEPPTGTGGTNGLTIHSCTMIDDPAGLGEKYWTFSASGANLGLATYYQGRTPVGGTTCSSTPNSTAMTQNQFTWTQDSAGNNYIGTVYTTADLGASYAVAKETTQTVDTHGNVTQVNNYDWGSSVATRTYNYTYLSTSNYTNAYIFNRLLTATVTPYGGSPGTLANISYDGYSLSTPSGSVPREWDSAYTSGAIYRGNVTSTTDVSGNTTTLTYNIYGNATATWVNGVASTVSTSNTTGFAAPDSITVGSLTTSMTYNAALSPLSETTPSSVSVDIGYDLTNRPTSSTSPFGATTTTVYNDTATPPNSCTSVNGRWTETQLDGLGRPVLTLTGNGTPCGSGTPVSQAATTYGPCGCSPLGKMMSQEVPHLPTVVAPNIAVTSYTYDGIGRTHTKSSVGAGSTPDTQGTTTYAYWARTVEVTDPAGNWKEFAMDAFGNLIEVVEPKPLTDTSSWGSYYVSDYTYDVLNHLTYVSMPRSTGTQTRSFTYSGNNLSSATNAENGTVSYTYVSSGNGIGKVATRTDHKGQATKYSYDSYARLSEVQRYPSGLSGGEDTCQREVYYYDGTTPISSSTVTSAMGHLSAVQYWGGFNPGLLPTCDTTFTEAYTYSSTSGAPVGKSLSIYRGGGLNFSLGATYSYDNEGRMTGETYPTDSSGNTGNVSYAYDSMGRLNTMTDNVSGLTVITGTTYGPANEITQIYGGTYFGAWGGETRGYNSLKQLTGLASGTYSTPLSITYAYPSTGNNGKISSQTDVISGETVTYTYDALNRLATAEDQSTFRPSWGQGFSYDGFGNLTQTNVIQGSAPTMTASYDANNHAGGEDLNGNPTTIPLPASGTSATGYYDVENRLVSYGGTAILFANYSYAPDNKRVWRGSWNYSSGTRTTDEITFWSLNGQKMATYALTTTTILTAAQTGINYYFGGKLIKNNNGWVYSDRLSSIGKFYPYGMERPSATTNGTEKFTGYERDAESGNDYAVNRYMLPGTGRFLTPDPYHANNGGPGNPPDPSSWNRYAYTRGDPINRVDPGGTCDYSDYDPLDPSCDPTFCQASGVNCPSGPGGSSNCQRPYCTGDANTGGMPSIPGNVANGVIGVAVAENALKNNLGCATAISGTGASGTLLASYLDMISIVPTALQFSASVTDNGATYSYGVQVTYGYSPGNGTIQLNNNPALQNLTQVLVGTLNNGQPVYANLLASMEQQYGLLPGSLTPATFWAIIELHELAHIENAIPDDVNNNAQSILNTGTVIDNCFKNLLNPLQQ